jgi:hypothetical protein
MAWNGNAIIFNANLFLGMLSPLNGMIANGMMITRKMAHCEAKIK